MLHATHQDVNMYPGCFGSLEAGLLYYFKVMCDFPYTGAAMDG